MGFLSTTFCCAFLSHPNLQNLLILVTFCFKTCFVEKDLLKSTLCNQIIRVLTLKIVTLQTDYFIWEKGSILISFKVSKIFEVAVLLEKIGLNRPKIQVACKKCVGHNPWLI